jgi:2-isopropylmalate synthase
VVALCDTNGGMLPPQVQDVVGDVLASTSARIGIHCHNDTGCAVANSLAAVEAGASHVQGTVNGYGERTGNADILTVISNLQLKAGHEVVAPERLRDATRLAHAISEVTNVPPYSRQPYVGSSAFAHKAGLHASALKVDPNLYQHTDPSAVGNGMRTLVSDMAGRASIHLKAAEIGVDLTGQDELVASVLAEVKDLELRGYTFDAADASFELLLRNALSGSVLTYFAVESWRVITDARGGELAVSEATVKLVASDRRFVATGEGNGPVNALDHALRQALAEVYPEIDKLELIDFRVRILDASHGTDAVTRVLIETSDGETSWNTLGVAANIVEASWKALVDGITFGLRRHEVPVR